MLNKLEYVKTKSKFYLYVSELDKIISIKFTISRWGHNQKKFHELINTTIKMQVKCDKKKKENKFGNVNVETKQNNYE